jgi:hypothetical protein
MRGWTISAVLCMVASAALSSTAAAQTPGAPVVPIPSAPTPGIEPFAGHVAKPDPVGAPRVPRHPFMASNGRSNLHNDAYMTDVYRRLEGPLGESAATSSTLFVRDCASVTFDAEGRIEAICVGIDRPVLALLDPTTFEVLAALELPPRQSGGGVFTDFSGGGYFYLDRDDRAVIPTTTRHLLVVAQAPGPSFRVEAEFDLTGVVPADDQLIAVLPDWDGRIWFASRRGRIGWVNPESGAIRSRLLSDEISEGVGNSFAVDEAGGVYVVTDAALYRIEARGGRPRTMWRHGYPNTGEVKPGQTEAGSGTTPTLMGRKYVAITDNAERMHVLILKRRRNVEHGRVVCRKGVFERGASATDQSLIGTRRSVVVENNYGYTGPSATSDGASTTPGLERVTIRRGGGGCRTVWRSDETAPSVVPKLAAGSGLVFTYTKEPSAAGVDPWFLTAIDYRTGDTVYKRLVGAGNAFNNNFAAITIGPDQTAYVGVIGGIANVR